MRVQIAKTNLGNYLTVYIKTDHMRIYVSKILFQEIYPKEMGT